MHWVEVDGIRLPKQIDGHPALEFCNTRAAWSRPITPAAEWLDDFGALATWCRHSGLFTDVDGLRARAAAEPREAERELAAAREFRDRLYPVLLGGDDPADVAAVAALAQRSAARYRLVRIDGGYAWRPEDTSRLDAPLLAIARAASELLCSRELELVRACPGEDCGWLFRDRRGRRRWCSMASCGNRAKVRSFARRKRDTPP